jgi:polysaccharide pyruvyl transferase WcaK-like protein
VELAPTTEQSERGLAQIAACRVVVAMRYHAGIGAVAPHIELVPP